MLPSKVFIVFLIIIQCSIIKLAGASFWDFFGWFKVKDKCPTSWNQAKLENDLNKQLYGQHLVKLIVPRLLKKHMTDKSPKKALVLSFHGWTGCGKSYVSKIIAKNMFEYYRERGESKFVKMFFGTHFNITDDKYLMRQWIKNNITSAVKSCQRSLFIFDEIDKMKEGVIDIIKPFLEEDILINSIDYKKSIFIFLSNTGGSAIVNMTYKYHMNGLDRTQITMKDMDKLLTKHSFNEYGGLHRSDIVEKNMISAYVPFLPLERKHIELCIRDDLKLRYHDHKPDEEFLDRVADELEYHPVDEQIYSKTGCRRLENKIDILYGS